jgi:1-pyrroline-5-carboxylate dehydrogenase
VGETGGKDFVFAHPSCVANEVATALVRGAFEYQGQKCSAASRAYIPKSKADAILNKMAEDIATIKMGPTDDLSCFFNAVIDEKAFDNITSYIAKAKTDDKIKIIAGGNYSKEVGYFIEPTVLVTTDPSYVTMCTELFGPVLTVYVYDDADWKKTLDIVNETSTYALTGAVFSQDRYALQTCMVKLRHAAGNFYVNDKPSGAVVGQQPFGGGRASGTNDKAGSYLNLLRWTSVRTIKETMVPPTDYKYPFMG